MGLLSVGMQLVVLPDWMGGTTGLALALTYSGYKVQVKQRKVKHERKNGQMGRVNG